MLCGTSRDGPWMTWYGMKKLPHFYALFEVHCYFNNNYAVENLDVIPGALQLAPVEFSLVCTQLPALLQQ